MEAPASVTRRCGLTSRGIVGRQTRRRQALAEALADPRQGVGRAIQDTDRREPRRLLASAEDAHQRQPTLPSICSSINRLHSTAYSIGNVRVIGSMKPLTIMLMACCSERPRLIK